MKSFVTIVIMILIAIVISESMKEKHSTPANDSKQIESERFYEANKSAAALACEPLVQKAAVYDYRWKSMWDAPKFGWYVAHPDTGILTMIGDGIEFQNALGAWMRMTYYCDFNVQTKSASVSVQRGQHG